MPFDGLTHWTSEPTLGPQKPRLEKISKNKKSAPFLSPESRRNPRENSFLRGAFAPERPIYHNGFRDYIPAYGRYAESDPVGLLGGMNTYNYVFNNPYKYSDPQGLEGGGEVACFFPETGVGLAICIGSVASDMATIGAGWYAVTHTSKTAQQVDVPADLPHSEANGNNEGNQDKCINTQDQPPQCPEKDSNHSCLYLCPDGSRQHMKWPVACPPYISPNSGLLEPMPPIQSVP